MRGKEKVTLSDWIHFFIENKHKNETRILACITVIISLIVLLFVVWGFQWSVASSYEQILGDENIAETTKQAYMDLNKNVNAFRNILFTFILAFIVFPFSLSINPNYRNSKRLLNEILKSDGYVDINYIRSEWKDRKKIKWLEKLDSWIKEKIKKD